MKCPDCSTILDHVAGLVCPRCGYQFAPENVIQDNSSDTPSETGGACGGNNSGPSCSKPCDGSCKKRRGPVEVLARELFEILPHDKGFGDWDEFARCNWSQHENLLAIAKHVLRKFEGKVYL